MTDSRLLKRALAWSIVASMVLALVGVTVYLFTLAWWGGLPIVGGVVLGVALSWAGEELAR